MFLKTQAAFNLYICISVFVSNWIFKAELLLENLQ